MIKANVTISGRLYAGYGKDTDLIWENCLTEEKDIRMRIMRMN